MHPKVKTGLLHSTMLRKDLRGEKNIMVKLIMNNCRLLVLTFILFGCNNTIKKNKYNSDTIIAEKTSSHKSIAQSQEVPIAQMSVADLYDTLIAFNKSIEFNYQALLKNKISIRDIIMVVNTVDRYFFSNDSSFCSFREIDNLKIQAKKFRKLFYHKDYDFFGKILGSYKHGVSLSTHSYYFPELKIECPPYADREYHSFTLKCD